MQRKQNNELRCTLRITTTASALTAEQRVDYKPGTVINQACQAERAKFAIASEITQRERRRLKMYAAARRETLQI